MKIKDAFDALVQFAPLPLQDEWDNAGLQVGLTETEITGVLLCLDVNEQIIDEAVEKGCNLVVSHHPLLFRGLKEISDSNYVQRTVLKAIKNNIAVISMHTNLDNAIDGVNYKIAEKLGLSDLKFLQPHQTTPLSGSGVIGILTEALSSVDIVEKVKKVFECGCVMTNALIERPIKKIALCGGAGAFLLPDAIAQGADAFLTGEMHYHEYFGHEDEIQIMVIGHYESEHFTNEILHDVLAKALPKMKIIIAETNTNPIHYWKVKSEK